MCMSDTAKHSMDAAEDLTAYKGAKVAKVFPGYGEKPFRGKVVKVDTKGSDDKPFKIAYEDGDSEWVTVEEFKAIMVDKATSQKKRSRSSTKSDQQDAPPPAAAAADQHTSSKKQKSSSKAHSTDAAAVAAAEQQQQQQQAPVGAGADTVKGFNAEAEKRKLKEQQQTDLGGMTSFTLTAGAVQKAADKVHRKAPSSSAEAAAAAPAAAKDVKAPAAACSGKGQQQERQKSSKPAAADKNAANPAAAGGAAGAGSNGFASAPASPSVDTQGLLTAIHQNAEPTGNKDRQVVRLPYSGPSAAMLPAMSQAIICDGHIEVSLISARPRSSMTPGRTLTSGQGSASAAAAAAAAAGGGVYRPGQHDYAAEAAVLLAELDKLLQQAGTDKTHLTYVRVSLRSMHDGLFGFTETWNSWVDRKFAPRMTLLEAAGPIPSCGIILEAEARINAA